MHQDAAQSHERACAYCGGPFDARKPWAAFCKPQCRAAFDVEVGATGTVKAVRRLTKGRVSVILWLDGPAAERAIHLEPGAAARVTRSP